MPGDDKLKDLNIVLSYTGEYAAGVRLPISAEWNNANYEVNFDQGEFIIGADQEIALVRPNLSNESRWEAQAGPALWFYNYEGSTRNFFTPAADDDEFTFDGRYSNTNDMVNNTAEELIKAYDGQTVDVKFGHYAIEGNKWESLVLPFSIRVKDLSRAFGYALIDVLDETKSNASNISFRKEIYTIEANTPFLIKVPYSLDMVNVEFKSVTVESPASKDDLTVEAAGNKYIGTYKGAFEAMNGTAYFRDGEMYNNTTNLTVFPLGAYLEFAPGTNPANVRITIEEEEGTITAIKAVGAEDEIAAQGAA